MRIIKLGPVNIYFAPALLPEKGGGKARSAGHSGPMAKLCNAAPAFFVRNPKGRDGFRPALRYSRLQRLTLPRGSCLVLDEIRRRRGCEININRPEYSCRVSATSRALDGVAPRAGLILQDPGLVPS